MDNPWPLIIGGMSVVIGCSLLYSSKKKQKEGSLIEHLPKSIISELKEELSNSESYSSHKKKIAKLYGKISAEQLISGEYSSKNGLAFKSTKKRLYSVKTYSPVVTTKETTTEEKSKNKKDKTKTTTTVEQKIDKNLVEGKWVDKEEILTGGKVRYTNCYLVDESQEHIYIPDSLIVSHFATLSEFVAEDFIEPVENVVSPPSPSNNNTNDNGNNSGNNNNININLNIGNINSNNSNSNNVNSNNNNNNSNNSKIGEDELKERGTRLTEYYIPDNTKVFIVGTVVYSKGSNRLQLSKNSNPLIISTKPEFEILEDFHSSAQTIKYFGYFFSSLGLIIPIGFALIQSFK